MLSLNSKSNEDDEPSAETLSVVYDGCLYQPPRSRVEQSHWSRSLIYSDLIGGTLFCHYYTKFRSHLNCLKVDKAQNVPKMGKLS